MPAIPATVLLLMLSNVFMTFTWYAHLRDLSELDYLRAVLCIAGAVYFVFRK